MVAEFWLTGAGSGTVDGSASSVACEILPLMRFSYTWALRDPAGKLPVRDRVRLMDLPLPVIWLLDDGRPATAGGFLEDVIPVDWLLDMMGMSEDRTLLLNLLLLLIVEPLLGQETKNVWCNDKGWRRLRTNPNVGS